MAHPGHHAAERPHETALLLVPSGVTVTWSELRRRVVAAANALVDAGLRAGDHVAFCIENRVELVVLVWACQDAGFRYTPVSTRLTAEEVGFIVGDCGAKVFLHTAVTAEAATAVSDGVPASSGSSPLVIDLDDGDPLGASTDDPPRYRRVEGTAMLYSSGTTGRPKGVWRAAPPEPIESLPPGDQLMSLVFGVTPESVYLSTAPLYHSAPLTFLLFMGRVGAATVVMERFESAAALASIDSHRVTHSQWVPTMFVRLLRLPEEERRAHDLSSHEFAIHGAGPCAVSVKEAMLDWWGPIIHEYYAGTEGAGTCLIGPEEWLAHRGSVGRPVRGRVMVLDDEGRELGPGEVGQVWFSESGEFAYLNDAAKTAEARTAAGAGSFGDLGYLDEEGYLYLTGRRHFTIVVGGVNVYPREVEDVLLAHPSVADAVVFGVPDDEYGEQVAAVVETVGGAGGDPALEQLLLEHCRRSLATFKLPRSVRFVERIPRDQTGKLRAEAFDDLRRARH